MMILCHYHFYFDNAVFAGNLPVVTFLPTVSFLEGVAILSDILEEGCPHPLGHSHGVLWTNYLQPCDRYNLIKIRCLMYLIFLS